MLACRLQERACEWLGSLEFFGVRLAFLDVWGRELSDAKERLANYATVPESQGRKKLTTNPTNLTNSRR